MRNEKPNKPNYGKTALRLMKYVASTFKLQFLIVVIAIIISAIAGMSSKKDSGRTPKSE